MAIKSEELTIWATNLCRRTPDAIWQSLCEALRNTPNEASLETVIALLPSNLSSDLYHEFRLYLQASVGTLSWSEIGCCFQTIGVLCRNFDEQQTVELVWSGPIPGVSGLRRTDQVLYDLINSANKEVLIVTFAAAKVSYLEGVLLAAHQRGARVSMVLEFEQESAGQLSVDAIASFPGLASFANIFYWPYEKRERNVAGKPGKLHAKCAVVDDSIIIGSANLTEDAFTRNMEMGLLIKSPQLATTTREHYEKLIESGILQRWK